MVKTDDNEKRYAVLRKRCRAYDSDESKQQDTRANEGKAKA